MGNDLEQEVFITFRVLVTVTITNIPLLGGWVPTKEKFAHCIFIVEVT
jgi:hypothetical protein